METLNSILDAIDGYVWGVPLIVIILFVGFLLTIRLGCLQVLNLPNALRYMLHNEKGGEGEVSSFGALCTALAATIGTGNIVGVATAIGTGGPGALFWMEVAAFLGMATKYAEGLLAVKYRTIGKDGKVLGGPFYYIETGIKERFGWNMKWLAVIFAVFGIGAGLLGIGTITQVNGITSAMARLTPNAPEFINLGGNSVSWTTAIAGLLVTIFAATVIIGGLKRIAKVSTYIVPIMAIVYILACVLLLLLNFAQIPLAIQTIVQAAFNPSAITGGAVGTIFIAMQKGIARGICSGRRQDQGTGSSGFRLHDWHLLRHHYYLYHDRPRHRGFRRMGSEARSRRREHHHGSLLPRTCHRSGRFCHCTVLPRHRSGVLRVHHDSWLGILFRKVPAVPDGRQERKGHLDLPLGLHRGNLYRPVPHSERRMDQCRHLQWTHGFPELGCADSLERNCFEGNQGLP